MPRHFVPFGYFPDSISGFAATMVSEGLPSFRMRCQTTAEHFASFHLRIVHPSYRYRLFTFLSFQSGIITTPE